MKTGFEIMMVLAVIAMVIGFVMAEGGGMRPARGSLVFVENARPRVHLDNIQVFGKGELPSDQGQALKPGLIYAANESRFSAEYYSEPLTNYVVGWRDPSDLMALLDFLFPPVQVGRRFEFKKAENAEEFLSETDDERSIGSDFKRIEYRGTSVNEKTKNKGLTVVVDLDEVAETPDWQNVYTGRIMRRLLRNEVRRAITLAAATANNTAKTWDTTAGKDPDQDIFNVLNTATGKSGIRPNRGLIGEEAWSKRIMAHRAQASAGGYASAGLTVDELAKFLALSGGIRLSSERYQSAANAKSKITPDICLFFYAENGVGPEDPTNFKRFWSPCEGGVKFRVYVQQLSSKLVAITVEHYSNLVATSTLGVEKLTIT